MLNFTNTIKNNNNVIKITKITRYKIINKDIIIGTYKNWRHVR